MYVNSNRLPCVIWPVQPKPSSMIEFFQNAHSQVKAFCLFVILFCTGFTHAQMSVNGDTLYGNEWIDYSIPHFKIPIAQDEIYRLTYDYFQNAGIPADQISANEWQIFHNGQPVALYISTSSSMQQGDYIEFFGEKNRGWLDDFLYSDPDQHHLNREYSLVNDTAAYFLSWTASANGPRFSNTINDLSNLPPPESHFLRSQNISNTTSHIKQNSFGSLRASVFKKVEGYGSKMQNLWSTNLILPYHLPGFPGFLEIEAAMQNSYGISFEVNGIEVGRNDIPSTSVFRKSYMVPEAAIESSLTIQIQADSDVDLFSVANIDLKYPSTYHFDNQEIFVWEMGPSPQKRYLEISGFDHDGENPILYDILNQERIECAVENDLVKVVINPGQTDRKLTLINVTNGSLHPETPKKIEFQNPDRYGSRLRDYFASHFTKWRN